MKTINEPAGGWGDMSPNGIITGGGTGDTLFFDENTSVNGQEGFMALWETIKLNLKTPLKLIWTGADVQLTPINHGINGVAADGNKNDKPENKEIRSLNGITIQPGGGFYIAVWENIIFRNFRIIGDNQGGDNAPPHGGKGMTLRNSQRIWIDHMEFDGEATIAGTERIKDGSLDGGSETDFVTISNCYIRRSSKTCLIGGSDTSFDDIGKLRYTWRNNLFENNHTRQPFARFGKIHLLNNVFRYNPVFTNSAEQYPWARIIEIGVESQFYSQGNKYYSHRYLIKDTDWDNPSSLSGLISDGDWFDPNPFDPNRWNGLPETEWAGPGSLRSGNVEWNPNNIEGYNYPLGLLTPDQAEVYVDQWAGAKYHLIPTEAGLTLTLTTTAGGTATRNPATGDIEQNATVILTATPSSGFNFSRWENVLTGQVLSTSTTYNHVMLDDISIVAVFVSDVVDPGDAIRFCRIDEPIV